ncbi:MAG: Rieske 2Fe-2S domain-containing protein, partial [Pirellulales bacterium]
TASSTPPSLAPPQRRSFFRWLTAGMGAVAATLAGAPLLGYLVGARKPRVVWVSMGAVADFPLNQTRHITFDNPLRQPWDGVTSQTGVFVRNVGPAEEKAGDQFLVLAVNCAHLGCPVSWFPQSGLFLCPCHGGVYYSDGARASGPPPRGMYHCVWRVRDDNVLEIQAPHYPTLQNTLRDTA